MRIAFKMFEQRVASLVNVMSNANVICKTKIFFAESVLSQQNQLALGRRLTFLLFVCLFFFFLRHLSLFSLEL